MNRIPDISRETVEELYKKVKPLVRDKNGRFYTIEDVDLFKTAFTWSPILKEEVDGLEVVTIIITFHVFGAPAFFKPSIAEVLAQIPRHLLTKIDFFEVWTEGLGIQNVLSDGYHFTHTILYRRDE